MFKDEVLNSFLQNNSLSALTEAVSMLIGCPVIIVDEAFHIAASFAANGSDYEEYRTAISHSELSFAASAAISERAETAENGAFSFGINNKNYRVLILGSGKVKIGYMICVFNQSDSPVCTDEELMFAAALISKQLCLERRQIASNSAEEILISLLNGEFSDKEHFGLQAQTTYLSHFHPERFAVVDLCNYDGRELADDFLRKELESGFHGSHPFVYKDRIILFIHKDHNINLLRDTAKNEGLGIVLSEQLESIFELKKMYKTASAVLDYLLLRGRTGFLETADKYSLIISLNKLAEDEIITNEIKALNEYDRKNSGELIKTLYTYLCCHRSLNETCERLFTHRNTVLYRIRKIKEDFGLDLGAPEKHLKYLLSAAVILAKNGETEMFVTD